MKKKSTARLILTAFISALIATVIALSAIGAGFNDAISKLTSAMNESVSSSAAAE